MGNNQYLIDTERRLAIDLGKGIWSDVFPKKERPGFEPNEYDYEAWKRGGEEAMGERFYAVKDHNFAEYQLDHVVDFGRRVYRFCDAAKWKGLWICSDDDYVDAEADGHMHLADSIDGPVRLTEVGLLQLNVHLGELHLGHDDMIDESCELFSILYADLMTTRAKLDEAEKRIDYLRQFEE